MRIQRNYTTKRRKGPNQMRELTGLEKLRLQCKEQQAIQHANRYVTVQFKGIQTQLMKKSDGELSTVSSRHRQVR